MLVASIYGIFQPLTDVFQAVLKFFHDSGGIGWGLSIVMLTIAVRAVMVPLTLRQIKSMVRMQALAPQMKEIQQKYKEDKGRQQEEMMKFYRENNVNPLSSCLPLILQLPVFFALYAMLRQSLRSDICPGVQRAFREHYAHVHHISLAAAHGHTAVCGGRAPGAGFLFISDLTAKATGLELIALLVLYVGSQLASSVLMSGASMDPNQRKIMMFMPLIFVIFILNFPAGFLVYWITTNLWTIGQQYVVKRRIGPARAAAAAAAEAGGGAVVVGGSGGPPGDGSGGGLGGRLFARLREAQENAQASRSGGAKATGGGNGGGGGATAPAAKTGGRGPGSARADGGRTGAGRSGDGADAARSGNGSAAAKSGSGSGTRPRSGSNSGGGSASGPNGNGASADRGGGPPPRSPRKKKKRSGRRR